MCSAPNAYAIGIDARASARPTSPMIKSGRRRSRSTHTPAGSAKKRNGSCSKVVSTATANACAWRILIAAIGSASSVIWEPNSLTDCPPQSLRKSGWRQSPPVGQLVFRLLRAMEPLTVIVRRAGVVEARHRIHAVAVQDGAVIAEAGDPGLVCFMRSSSKPLQALPLARARPDLEPRDLAIASASHLASPAQLEAVRALLAKAPAAEDELECGPAGKPPRKLNHNCSGKHAGMLALCRAQGWRSEGYRLEGHRVQREMLAVHAEAAEVPADELRTGIDGCGVLTFALPLERMAHAFARLSQLEGGDRIAAGMKAYPDLIRGPRAADTRLMKTLPGWIAKGGAEGLLCASGVGIGVALKVEDGNGRAVGPAAAAFFRQLELDLGDLSVVTLENSRGELVGEITSQPRRRLDGAA